ncbi:hypothetical protein ACVWXX_000214 [Bacillus toyonensis]
MVIYSFDGIAGYYSIVDVNDTLLEKIKRYT